MALIPIILVLIVVGMVLWIVNTYIPMAGGIKAILNAVVILCVIVWLLSVFGLINVGSLGSMGSSLKMH